MTAKVKKVRTTISVSLTAVGFRYHMDKGERSLFNNMWLENIAPAVLKLEPENLVDSDAIAVYVPDFRNEKIAYVARPANRELAELLRRGAKIESCLLYGMDDRAMEAPLEVTLSYRPAKKPANKRV